MPTTSKIPYLRSPFLKLIFQYPIDDRLSFCEMNRDKIYLLVNILLTRDLTLYDYGYSFFDEA